MEPRGRSLPTGSRCRNDACTGEPITITGLPFTVAGTELHGQDFEQYATVDLCDSALPGVVLASFGCTNDGTGTYYQAVAVTTIGGSTAAAAMASSSWSRRSEGPTGLPGPVSFLKVSITGDTVRASSSRTSRTCRR